MNINLKSIFVLLTLVSLILSVSCKKNTTDTSIDSKDIFKAAYSTEPIPTDIDWLTNDSDPEYASEDAQKGGTIRYGLLSFPLTFRTVGPDSNSGFRSYILDNQLSLINIHPNTENIIPELATHWAFDDDKKTMYFKLNKKARWSDGEPVTAHDYAYTLEFMRSKHIVAPWYNDYYTKEIERVIVYDDHTLAVVATKEDPDLYLKIAINPMPRHFYGQLDDQFVMKYNWKIEPNTGPYQIDDFKKGKYVTFKRKKDWWAKDLKYYKNRFNVDTVKIKIIKDQSMMWEYFKKGEIDYHAVNFPSFWHEKADSSEFHNGYINKIWFFNDIQQPKYGMYLNQDKPIFKDKNVRYAFAHAMNIQKVIEKVLRSEYYRLEHMFVGYGKYSNDTIKARRFDINKVKHYMEKAGWKRGEDGIWEKQGTRFSVNVTYSADAHTRRLVVLKEEALKAGVELVLDKLDGATSYKKVMEKNHDVAWMGWSTSLRPRFWEGFHSVNAHKPQTNNITNNDNPEMDILIDQHRATTDEDEKLRLSHQLQQMVYDIGDYVPTFMVPYTREAYWRWFKLPLNKGTKTSETLFEPFQITTGGLFWYDKDLYDETQKAMKSKKTFEPVTIIDETYKMDILK